MTVAERALDGLRVVDFGQYVAGPLAAMMLADQGADVVRIDPPRGPRWQHYSNAVLQRGKRTLTLDLKTGAGIGAASALVAEADIVIENFRPGVMSRLGLGYEQVSEANPGLIYASMPGFGSTDPRSQLQGWEGIVGAATGLYSPHPREPLAKPAVSALPVASTFAAFISVNCISAALLCRARTAQGQWIEVPLFDAMFEAIGTMGQRTPIPEVNPIHSAADGDFLAADGRWVHVVLIAPRHFRAFADKFFPKEWAEAGLAEPATLLERPDMALDLRARLPALFATKTAEEWRQEAIALGVPLSISQSTEDWLKDPQAKAISASINVEDPVLGHTRQAGFPVTLSATPPMVTNPRMAESTLPGDLYPSRSKRPWMAEDPIDDELPALSGVRVLDLTQVLAGPTCGRILAELGAQVLKVNNPRSWSVGHLLTNSGKNNMLVDISLPGGKEVIADLLAGSDVVMENFALGAAERLGIGEARVRGINPGVIYASVSASTSRGPLGATRGWEPMGQSPTGIMLRNGDGIPRFSRLMICDYGTGHLAAFAVLLGLLHRSNTGVGQHVEASLMQTGTYLQIPFAIDFNGIRRDEPRGPSVQEWSPMDGLYETSDGWISVHGDEGALRTLGKITGLAELGDSRSSSFSASLRERFRSEPTEVWVDRLTRARIAAHSVLSVEEAMESAVARERGLSVVREHYGIGLVRSIGPGTRLSRTPTRLTKPASLPGADSRRVLESLGWGERWDELVATGSASDHLIDAAFVAL